MKTAVLLTALFVVAAPTVSWAKGSGGKKSLTCKDGSKSKAKKGACSHHGGIAAASTAKAGHKARASGRTATPAKHRHKARASGRTAAPQGRTTGNAGTPNAKCKDGTLSYSTQRVGTCSRHGGVRAWMNE